MSQEHQIGENNLKDKKLLNNGEKVDFKFESAAVFKRLADDIYESKEAGIREPLQNSLTAIRNARKEDYIDEGEGVVNITVKDNNNITSVKIQDNGVGISNNVLNNVLSVIGRSTNRDEGSVSGKYGMGFLAFYKLVGTDGAFKMHSRSRRTDEDIKCIWKPGGYEKDTDDELKDILDDEYGTVFKLSTNESVSDIRDWVEKHAEWSRIPVRYEEYDSNGNISFDEEYHCEDISNRLNGPTVKVSNEYYDLVVSFDGRGNDALLINSPIEYSYRKYGGIMSLRSVTRLKNENGIIIKGPNKGLTPVKEAEYENMSDERKDNYILESNISEDDIQLPKPTGTREKLRDNEDFWSYLDDKFKSELNNMVKTEVEKFKNNNIYDLSEAELVRIIKIVSAGSGNQFGTASRHNLKSVIKNNPMTNMSDEEFDKLYKLTCEFYYKNYEYDHVAELGDNRLYNLISDVDSGRDVYMYYTYNREKDNLVKDMDGVTAVLKVEDTDMYDELSKFGFRKLKNVKSFVDNNDKNNDTESKSTNDKDILERDLTVYTGKGRSNVNVKSDEWDYNTDYVIFPSSTDRLVSDYKNFVNYHVSVARCLVKQAEYLTEKDNVFTIDEFIKDLKQTSYNTSNGVMTLEEITEKIHDSNTDVYHSEQDLVKENTSNIIELIKDDNDYESISEHSNKDDVIIVFNNINSYKINFIYMDKFDTEYSEFKSLSHISPNEYYVDLHYEDLTEDEYYKTLKIVRDTSEEYVKNIIESIVDNNVNILESDSNIESEKFITDEGFKTLKELRKNNDSVLVHSIDEDLFDRFEDNINSIKEEVYNEVESSYRINWDLPNIEYTGYVIMNAADARELYDAVEGQNDFYIINGSSSHSSFTRNSVTDIKVYKNAMLEDADDLNLDDECFELVDELN